MHWVLQRMFTVSSLLNVTGQTALVACDVLDLHTPCFCHTDAALGSFQPWQTAEKQGEVRVSEAQTALLKELEEWKERCSRLLGRAWHRTSQKGWCLPENKSNSPELVQTLTSCLSGCFGIAKDWIIIGSQAWTQGRQPTIFDSRYVMFQILYWWYDVDTRGRLQADKDDAEERSRIEMQRLHAQERCSNLCICVLNHHESPKSHTLFIFVPTQSISCFFTCRPLKTQHGFEMTKRSSRHCDLPPGCHLMILDGDLMPFCFLKHHTEAALAAEVGAKARWIGLHAVLAVSVKPPCFRNRSNDSIKQSCKTWTSSNSTKQSYQRTLL